MLRSPLLRSSMAIALAAVALSCGTRSERETVTAPVPVVVQSGDSGDGVVEEAARVTLCHKQKSMSVPSSAVPDHLGHGDTLGACGPQAATGGVRGRVLDFGSTPVPGANVLACPSGDTATSDASGSYQMPVVPVGSVTVKARLGSGDSGQSVGTVFQGSFSDIDVIIGPGGPALSCP